MAEYGQLPAHSAASEDGVDDRARTWRATARNTLRSPGLPVAVMILLICVPVRYDAGASNFGLGDVASTVLVVIAAAAAARNRQQLSRRLALIFGGVVLAASICAAAGADTSASLPGWLRYLQLFVVVPLAVVLVIRSRRDALLVLHTAILAAVVEGGVGVWQYVTGNGAFFGGEGVRAVGTFGATDVIAMSVIVSFGLVVSVGLALGSSGRRRLGYLAIAVALLVPLGLSLSRGSWIATAVALLLITLIAGVRVFAVAVVATAATVTLLAGGLGLGAGLVEDRVSSIGTQDSSVSDRYDLWRTAVDMWGDHPLTGVGIKAFPSFRDAYAPLSLNSGSDVDQTGLGYQRQELLSPHNQYLLVLAEQGVVGALAFLALLLVIAAASLLVARRASPKVRGVGLVIAGLVVWQLVQFCYGDLGGASSLMSSVVIGLGAWWGLEGGGVPSRGGHDGH